ncbi:hypothetical protein KCU73_g15566, partial [Aureobasidium melanogenum]
GTFKAYVEKVMDWEKIVEAHQLMESNKTKGKIIMTINCARQRFAELVSCLGQSLYGLLEGRFSLPPDEELDRELPNEMTQA